MQKIFTLIFSVLCGITMTYAQIALNRASHQFRVNDKHSAQEVEFMEPGMNGQGLVWDFSQVVFKGEEDYSTFTQVDNEDYNMVVSRTSDHVHFFYNITDKANEYKGYTIGGYKVLFDKPLIKTSYPQTYGTFFEGNYSGTISIDEVVTGKVGGTYSTEVDATGTVLLPGNLSLPVIRVKTMETISRENCSCGNLEIEKYLWYTDQVRYPLFVSIIITSFSASGAPFSASKHSYVNTNVVLEPKVPQMAEMKKEIDYSVSPNPFRDRIEISYSIPQDTKVSIDLYSSQGLKLASIVPAQLQSGAQTVSFNTAPYVKNEGVYFVKMYFGDKLVSQKIIKSSY